MLLRGSSLKNTEFVYGMVIYSGHETKIMMNSIEPTPKLSSLEKEMNKLIIILFSLQMVLCFVSAVINYLWMSRTNKMGELPYLRLG